ncbi:MAG TPA: hypothetical protein VGS57_21355 [Thermoanaerobaculia bacterium]|nr:hypothetical protein [Thermoanaerobaculia bacterium]
MTTRTIKFGFNGKTYHLQIPAKCPICHEIVVIQGLRHFSLTGDRVEAVFMCTNPSCERLFMGMYAGASMTTDLELRYVHPTEVSISEISAVVSKISPEFTKIYQEAKQARDSGLAHICGPGFRKAFEFLIKDYAKTLSTSDEDTKKIEGSFAGKVVNDYINDSRIQIVARRALWLGNDETHYLRRWTEHDVDDLIALIQLTVHWIEIDDLSRRYQAELPDA